MEDKDDNGNATTSDGKVLLEKIDRFISSGDGDDIVESVQNFADLLDVTLVEYESGFLESVDRIANLVKSLSKHEKEKEKESFGVLVNRMSGIHQRAMSILEVEFKSILGDQINIINNINNKTADESSTSTSINNINNGDDDDDDEAGTVFLLGYSDEMISHLNKLANALIVGGHGAECSELYLFVRMDQNLKFEKFSIDETQKMQWEAIEKEVSSWIKMFNNFCTSLLPSERRLVDAVFAGHPACISDTLFANLTRNVLFYFLSFAEAVMMTKRSAEKLFKFLDIYEAIRDNIPEVEKLLLLISVSPEHHPEHHPEHPPEHPEQMQMQLQMQMQMIKSAASLISSMLGESVFNIFIELEQSVKSDTAKTAVPGGAVHPLTRYTMNYLKYACEYSGTLEQVFKKTEYSDSDHPFQWQLAKIMELLDANLEAKSRLYKDPGLSLIFMMNNGRYILQKTKGTGEMRSLMGDPWVRKRSSDLRSYHTNYKRETWTKLLQCLSHEGLSVNGKLMKPVLKERFKTFNAMFDEIHRSQTTWVVSDEQLQSELRVSISAIVIPAYRSFMGRFSQVFTPGRQTEKYIKYQPEDIETCIEELFDGSTAHQPKKR